MYRLHRRMTKRLFALSLAFGLLLFETGLLVHEIDHHLSKSPDKVCFLCDAAHQIGNALPAHTPVIHPSVANDFHIAVNTSVYSQQITVAYSSRAPPFIPSV